MSDPVIIVVELLVLATVVAIVAKRIRIPYTVALVIVGFGLSLLRETGLDVFEALWSVELSKDLILLIFLPPLLFEGTINMDLEILRKNAWPVGLMATFGTFIATGIVGGSFYLFFGFSVAGALLVGAMLAPTDPVSVLAIFKEQGVNKSLATIVEGESVFNDGIGVVLFLVFLKMVPGGEGAHADAGHFELWHSVAEFFREIFVGAGVGLLLGYIVHQLLGRLDDRFTEVMISVALAYGAYVGALRLHGSGVIAVVAAGLIIGNYGKILSMSPTTRLALSTFWEIAAFLVNSLLFLLMGLACNGQRLLQDWHFILVAFAVMVIGRSLVVYGIFGLVNSFRKREPYTWAWRHVANWGGLRGSIPIALVLGIPMGVTIATGPDTAIGRADLTQIIFGVVILSLLIQGLSIGPLLKRLGFSRVPNFEREYELLRGRTISLKAAREALEDLFDKGEVSESIYRGIRGEIEKELERLSNSTASLLQKHYALHDSEFRRIADSLLLSERAALEDANLHGLLSEEAMEILTEDIDSKLAEDGNPFYTPEETDDVPDLVPEEEMEDPDEVQSRQADGEDESDDSEEEPKPDEE